MTINKGVKECFLVICTLDYYMKLKKVRRPACTYLEMFVTHVVEIKLHRASISNLILIKIWKCVYDVLCKHLVRS